MRYIPPTTGMRSTLAQQTLAAKRKESATPGSAGQECRLILLKAICYVFAVFVGARLFCLQGSEGAKWSQIASRQHDGSIRVQGARGTVLDANGRTLAASVKATAVGAHPRDVMAPRELAKQLAPLLDESETAIYAKLTEKKAFVWLARGLPLDVSEKVQAAKLTGISAVPEFRRVYPQGSVAGPVLGRIDRDGDGLSGLEHSFNSLLLAENMKFAVRRDARGRLLPAANVETGTEHSMLEGLPMLWDASYRENPEVEVMVRSEGNALQVTIDSVVQDILEQELGQAKQDAQAQQAFGLLLDAENGEILALAQSPGFDPNETENVSPSRLRNAVLQDSFEPGSTIKPLVAALALDANVINENDSMDCENGNYPFGSSTIRDVHPEKILSFRDVLVRSSNICMAKLGQRMGKKQLYKGLRDLGFGTHSKVELPGESKGILRSLDKWAEIDTLTHSFGQGFSVTALQLVQAYSALANGGILVHPTLVKHEEGAKLQRERVFSIESAETVAEILRGVTEDEHGTGLKAAISGIKVHGKTGTAQKARDDGRGYDPDRILASFIGFVDGNEIGLRKKLVMLVAVDEPGVKPRWGGTVAAPAFQRSMERILSHLLSLQSQNRVQTAASGAPRRSAES